MSVCDRAILRYQGNHEAATPIITLLTEGPSIEVIIIGNRRGGKARKASAVREITSSIHLLDIPAIKPKGHPIKIAKKTVKIAIL